MIDSPTTTPESAIDRYARTRDPDAFASLVRQYQRLVYAAASRQLARREDVEDATQQAFLNLARAAGSVRRDVGAWLYRAAQHAAIDLIRRDATRRRHESTLAAPSDPTTDALAEWRELSAAIDDAIAALPDDERSLVIEHFLAGRSQRDLAAATDTSQSTIQRRLESAVTRLREHLTQAGHGGPVAIVATELPKFGEANVPASLSAELTKVGLAVPAAKTAGAAMGAKVAAGVMLAATAVTATIVATRPNSPPPVVAATAPVPAVVPMPAGDPTPDLAVRKAAANRKLAIAYALAAGENLARHLPPYPPERSDYIAVAFAEENPIDDWESRAWAFLWRNGPLEVSAWDLSPLARRPDFAAELRDRMLKLKWFEADVEAIDAIPWTPPHGDYVLRDWLPPGDRVAALAKLAAADAGRAIRVERRVETRPCVVVRGEVHLPDTPAATEAQLGSVAVTASPLTDDDMVAWSVHRRGARPIEVNGDVVDALRYFDAPLIDDARLIRFSHGVAWHVDADARLSRSDPNYRERLQAVIDNLAKQLGGDWAIEDREIETWVAVVEK